MKRVLPHILSAVFVCVTAAALALSAARVWDSLDAVTFYRELRWAPLPLTLCAFLGRRRAAAFVHFVAARRGRRMLR